MAIGNEDDVSVTPVRQFENNEQYPELHPGHTLKRQCDTEVSRQPVTIRWLHTYATPRRRGFHRDCRRLPTQIDALQHTHRKRAPSLATGSLTALTDQSIRPLELAATAPIGGYRRNEARDLLRHGGRGNLLPRGRGGFLTRGRDRRSDVGLCFAVAARGTRRSGAFWLFPTAGSRRKNQHPQPS